MLLPRPGVSQIKSPPTKYNLFVSVGYGNTASANIRDYYNSIVDNYRAAGIPIQIQAPFGPTVIMNTAIILNVLQEIGAGVSFAYLYSPAFSNYQDYAGTVKIDGSISAYEFSLKMRYSPLNFGNISIFISPHINICHTSVVITQDVRTNNYQYMDYNWKMTKEGWGPGLQMSAGPFIRLDRFIIEVEGGYRYTWIHVADQTEERAVGTNKVMQPMDISFNGFYSLFTVGMEL